MQTIKSRFVTWFSLIALSLILSSCFISLEGPGDVPPDPPAQRIDLSGELPTATPSSQGFDEERLSKGLLEVGNRFYIRSMLIVRNGHLVAEEYFNGTHKDSLNPLRGATNIITSALIGIAIDEGFIKNEFEPLINFITDIDSAKRDITIQNLLTMTSGIRWDESTGGDFGDWLDSGDHLNYVLNRPLAEPPGHRFQYNSAGVHLLSLVIAEATGMSLLDFADENLFKPLGITSRKWEVDSSGFPFAGHGLHLRPIDLAKLGVLILQDGMSGDTELVSSDWLGKSVRTQFHLGEIHSNLQLNYGYLWWVESKQSNEVWLAWGNGGQFIYCMPDRNLVIVTTTALASLPRQEALARERTLFSLIAEYVLPAVFRRANAAAN